MKRCFFLLIFSKAGKYFVIVKHLLIEHLTHKQLSLEKYTITKNLPALLKISKKKQRFISELVKIY